MHWSKAFLAVLGLGFAVSVPASEWQAKAVADSWAHVESLSPCCDQWPSESFDERVTSRLFRQSLDTSRARLFDGKPAHFAVFALPPFEAPYYIQVGSAPKGPGRGLRDAYFFDPAVILLDESFNPTRVVAGFACNLSHPAKAGDTGYFGAIQIDHRRERHAVVYANPEAREKTTSFTIKGLVPLIVVPGAVPVSKDWTVPFGADGVVEIKMATPWTLADLRKQEGCRVVEESTP